MDCHQKQALQEQLHASHNAVPLYQGRRSPVWAKKSPVFDRSAPSMTLELVAHTVFDSQLWASLAIKRLCSAVAHVCDDPAADRPQVLPN